MTISIAKVKFSKLYTYTINKEFQKLAENVHKGNYIA